MSSSSDYDNHHAALLIILLLTHQRKFLVSGVIHTGISDHSLIFEIRKVSVIDKQENILEIRNMKNFNEEKFTQELFKQPWKHLHFCAEDLSAMWEIWKKTISRCPRQTCIISAQKDTINKGPLD